MRHLDLPTGGGADRYGRSFVQEPNQIGELALDEDAPLCETAAGAKDAEARAGHARDDARLAYRFVKRAFDIVFSLGVIAVLLVPSLLLCLAIRLESPGCPIYSQKRVGRIGRNGEVETFEMYKFRSMHADADECLANLKDLNEADGPLFKIKDDPRVTRIGKFIRKHFVDELPQFVNCLLDQIPLRITKTGQGVPCKISSLFALPSKEMRTKKALFLQAKVASSTCLRAVRNFFLNLTAQRVKLNEFLQNENLPPSRGGLRPCLLRDHGRLTMALWLGW